MRKLKSNCCGAALIGGIQCANCGADAGDQPLHESIQRVVEAHESLCLDVKEERERLIDALYDELAAQYAYLSDD
jgi:hypothetical protein